MVKGIGCGNTMDKTITAAFQCLSAIMYKYKQPVCLYLNVTQRSMPSVETDGTEEKVIHMSRASADIKNIFVGAFYMKRNLT